MGHVGTNLSKRDPSQHTTAEEFLLHIKNLSTQPVLLYFRAFQNFPMHKAIYKFPQKLAICVKGGKSGK